MFDLKYYDKLSKTENHFDEDKGNCMSRQYQHKYFSYKKGKRLDFWTKRINELPDNDGLKEKTLELYAKYGEKAIINFQKILLEDTRRAVNST